MKKSLLKKVTIGVLSFLMLAVPALVFAQVDWGLPYAVNVGLGTREIRDVVVSVIKVLLGLLGIIALLIILWGGFRWMTAAGNEEAVASAKKIIGAGVIGLIIIFVAYAVVLFIFDVVGGALK